MEEKADVKRVSDKEILVGENRIRLGEDNIIRVTAVGEVGNQTALECARAWTELLNTAGGKVDTLIDMNKSGKYSPKAREVFQTLGEDERIRKAAIWGAHPVARVLASFVIGATRMKDVRFFKSEEEALAWLKE